MVYQKPSLFRKKAANFFQSPDELNQTVTSMRPKTGLFIIGIALVLGGVLSWASLGSIKITLPGKGVLLKSDFYTYRSQANGALTQLSIQPGSKVEKGEVIAKLRLKDIEAKIEAVNAKRIRLEKEKQLAEIEINRKIANKKHFFLQARRKAQNELLTLVKKKGYLNFRQKDSQYLLKQGIISETEYSTLMAEYKQLLDREKSLQANIENIEWAISEVKQEKTAQLLALEEEIARALQHQNDLIEEIKIKSEIKAKVSGVITDVYLRTGDSVEVGQKIAVVQPEDNGKPFRLVAYIKAGNKHAVEAGMPVEIKPMFSKENKFVLGQVESISKVPVSKDSIDRNFHNNSLSEKIHDMGMVKEVIIKLDMDADMLDQLSNNDQPFQLTNGMMCQASIIIKESSPIELLSPLINTNLDG